MQLFLLWPVTEDVLTRVAEIPAANDRQISGRETPSHGHVHHLQDRAGTGTSLIQLTQVRSRSRAPPCQDLALTASAARIQLCEEEFRQRNKHEQSRQRFHLPNGLSLTSYQDLVDAMPFGRFGGCRADHLKPTPQIPIEFFPPDLALVVDQTYMAIAQVTPGRLAQGGEDRYTVFDTLFHVRVKLHDRHQRIEILMAELLQSTPRRVRSIHRLHHTVYGFPEPQFVLTFHDAPARNFAVPCDCRGIGGGICTINIAPAMSWTAMGQELQAIPPDTRGCDGIGNQVLQAISNDRLRVWNAGGPLHSPLPGDPMGIQWIFVAIRPPTPPTEQPTEVEHASRALSYQIATPMGRRSLPKKDTRPDSSDSQTQVSEVLKKDLRTMFGLSCVQLKALNRDTASLAPLHPATQEALRTLPMWRADQPSDAARIFTDGSFQAQDGSAAWAYCVLVRQEGTWTFGGFASGRVNSTRAAYPLNAHIAELHALFAALLTAGSLHEHEVVMHYDAKAAASVAQAEAWSRQNDQLSLRVTLLADYAAAHLRQLHWAHVTGHSGDPFNELVDIAAKRAANNIFHHDPAEQLRIAAMSSNDFHWLWLRQQQANAASPWPVLKDTIEAQATSHQASSRPEICTWPVYQQTPTGHRERNMAWDIQMVTYNTLSQTPGTKTNHCGSMCQPWSALDRNPRDQVLADQSH